MPVEADVGEHGDTTTATELRRDDESFFASSPEGEAPEQAGEFSRSSPAESGSRTEERLVPHPPLRPAQPAAPEAVKQAVDEVMAILSALREAVEKMDEVLELLEEAERQKTADEREIEALRQQLRRFHRPTEEIPRPPRSAPAATQVQSGGPRDSREQRPPYRGQRDSRERDRGRYRRRPAGPHDSHRPQGSPPPPAPTSEAAPPASESSDHAVDAGDPS